MGAFSLFALSSNTFFVAVSKVPITTGVSFLMMPAFSDAMASKVFPSRAIWSNPILVMMDSSGSITFVLSSLPPKPVSMMAMSTFSCTK